MDEELRQYLDKLRARSQPNVRRHHMRKLTIAAALMLCATAAQAQTSWTQQQMGPFTYYNGQNRQTGESWSGTAQQEGPFTYYNFNNRQTGHLTRCTQHFDGMFTYTNCN
jgi:hypothetical protein